MAAWPSRSPRSLDLTKDARLLELLATELARWAARWEREAPDPGNVVRAAELTRA